MPAGGHRLSLACPGPTPAPGPDRHPGWVGVPAGCRRSAAARQHWGSQPGRRPPTTALPVRRYPLARQARTIPPRWSTSPAIRRGPVPGHLASRAAAGSGLPRRSVPVAPRPLGPRSTRRRQPRFRGTDRRHRRWRREWWSLWARSGSPATPPGPPPAARLLRLTSISLSKLLMRRAPRRARRGRQPSCPLDVRGAPRGCRRARSTVGSCRPGRAPGFQRSCRRSLRTRR